jgi:hypothetical protein
VFISALSCLRCPEKHLQSGAPDVRETLLSRIVVSTDAVQRRLGIGNNEAAASCVQIDGIPE